MPRRCRKAVAVPFFQATDDGVVLEHVPVGGKIAVDHAGDQQIVFRHGHALHVDDLVEHALGIPVHRGQRGDVAGVDVERAGQRFPGLLQLRILKLGHHVRQPARLVGAHGLGIVQVQVVVVVIEGQALVFQRVAAGVAALVHIVERAQVAVLRLGGAQALGDLQHLLQRRRVRQPARAEAVHGLEAVGFAVVDEGFLHGGSCSGPVAGDGGRRRGRMRDASIAARHARRREPARRRPRRDGWPPIAGATPAPPASAAAPAASAPGRRGSNSPR